jgi:hypothetical protein
MDSLGSIKSTKDMVAVFAGPNGCINTWGIMLGAVLRIETKGGHDVKQVTKS